MRRVLFVAHHFPPIGGGGVQRALKLVRYLPEHGYEPVVLTGSARTFAEWTPADETMVGEVPSGLEVLRVPGPEPTPSSGRRRRAERLLDLTPAFDRWWVDGAVEVGRRADVDVVLGELVPYTTAAVGMRLSRALGRPWVADLQDPWALDEMWHYPSWAHRTRDRRRMRRALADAHAVVMNTPEAVVRVRDAFPELGRKHVACVPNGFDTEDFEAPPPPRDGARFRIVHSGYLHTDLGLRHRRTRRVRRLLGGMPVPDVDVLTRSHLYLLEAVDRVLAADPALADVLEVSFVGALSDADRQVAATSPVVRLHGYRSHCETVDLLRGADLLFLPMHDLPLGMRAGLVPGKTYEYLGAGLPILAAVPDGDARDLLLEAGHALLCRPSDVAGMAAAITDEVARWRAGRPPLTPRPDVVARYERRRQAAALAAVLDEVVAQAA